MQRKKVIAIIPARIKSRRFRGKILAEIFSMPMIGHVYKRTALCKDLDKIIIVTPDKEIREYAENVLGATVIMETDQYKNVFDSCADALKKYQHQAHIIYDIAVIISGDEPMITNDMIALAISPFYLEDDVKVSTLMCPVPSQQAYESPNTVKVVVDVNNNALYFSREPIPSPSKGIVGIPPLKVISVSPFDAQFLLEFRELSPTPLELIEDIPILRAVENGFKVKMIMSETCTVAVDTPEDIDRVRELMKDDPMIKRYLTSLN